MTVIPVVNCPDRACAEQRLAEAKKFLPAGSLLHIDVTDGIFASHRTWNDPFAWSKFAAPFPLEVHLMVEDPQDHADDWFAAGASRLVVQVETIDSASLHGLLSIAAQHAGEIMLSLDPESDPEAMVPYLGRVQSFQVLAVPPGAAGQIFLPRALDAINFLRQASPNATIEVDGGMDPRTARLAKSAGADTIVSASYIFGSDDPKGAYEELCRI